MPNYPVHTIASAPEKSKLALEQLQKAFGVLPNLPAVIANSPKLISSLVALFASAVNISNGPRYYRFIYADSLRSHLENRMVTDPAPASP